MSNLLSLYSITATLVLDSEGKRIYGNYYQSPSSSPTSNSEPVFQIPVPYPTLKSQHAFESSLFQKTYQTNKNGNIILLDNHIVVFKVVNDIMISIVGQLKENEIMLYQVLQGLHDALNIVLNLEIDKKSIQENFDFVSLAIDECIDNGIILETDGNVIASRVSKRPSSENTLNIELNERGLFNAFQFAKNTVKNFNF